ncbi:MAG: DUF2384 domain-containing protein [Cellvibrionaceae bacterium]|nr:DUF2384 domain-containing protein [Cellvibrionaceae bacterium]
MPISLRSTSSQSTPLSVEQKSHLGRIAAKQFLMITDAWGLTDNQRRILAGAATRTTISTWRKRVNSRESLQLGTDTYERILCLTAINRSLLCNGHASGKQPSKLLRTPLDTLQGNSLLDTMLQGQMIDLYNTQELVTNLK